MDGEAALGELSSAEKGTPQHGSCERKPRGQGQRPGSPETRKRPQSPQQRTRVLAGAERHCHPSTDASAKRGPGLMQGQGTTAQQADTKSGGISGKA